MVATRCTSRSTMHCRMGSPKTMANVRIGGARRVAAHQSGQNAAAVTVNDVLALSAGALRAYLIEQRALPSTPLIAMVPVSLRREDNSDGGGHMVGTVLCNLHTHVEDPAHRLRGINESMRRNKEVFTQLPRIQRWRCPLSSPAGWFVP